MDINKSRWWAAALVVAATGTSACASSPSFDSEAAGDEGPARVEPMKGTDVQRVILTAQAARRVGIETAPIRAARGHERLVPYAAVMYGAAGDAFVYTNPNGRTYVRRPIAIARIVGNAALVTDGPPSGTAVVTVGAAELLGTEYGVEE
jgi:hypothetical protein